MCRCPNKICRIGGLTEQPRAGGNNMIVGQESQRETVMAAATPQGGEEGGWA